MLRDLFAIRRNAARGRYERRVIPHPTFAPEAEVIASFESESPNSLASPRD